MNKVDVDIKKLLFSDVAPDGGLGTQWVKMSGEARKGTATMAGSAANITEHKNIRGGIIASSSEDGSNTITLQYADITAESRKYFMGGTIETSAAGINYKKPSGKQAIYKSVMVVGVKNTVEYAVNVRINAYPTRGDADLAFLQIDGLIEIPTKEGVEAQGSWDNIDADANDILTFVMAEQTVEATIDTAAHTVAITVANGTDPTSLIPTIGLSLGANATPNSLEVQDFTNPVTYAVENANGVSQEWIVTVTVAV